MYTLILLVDMFNYIGDYREPTTRIDTPGPVTGACGSDNYMLAVGCTLILEK